VSTASVVPSPNLTPTLEPATPSPAPAIKVATRGFNNFAVRYPQSWEIVKNENEAKAALIALAPKSGGALVFIEESDPETLELTDLKAKEEEATASLVEPAKAVRLGNQDAHLFLSDDTLAEKAAHKSVLVSLYIPPSYPSIKAKAYRIVYLADKEAPDAAQSLSDFNYIVGAWQWSSMDAILPLGAEPVVRTPVVVINPSSGSSGSSARSCIEISTEYSRRARDVDASYASRGMMGSGQHQGALRALDEERAAALTGCAP
jgi:hypothetical protein